jgi:YegS/Rv2252/BmrU family lipid kinase
MKTKVIMNPAARKGGSGENWVNVEPLLKQYLDDFDVSFTERPGHARELAHRALDDGYERFIPIGGDGTANEVLNGLTANGALLNPNTIMSVIPAGTANEICRTLGLLDDPLLPYKVLTDGEPVKVDMQMVSCEGFDGNLVTRHGTLLTSIASAAEISYKTNNSKYIKRLGAEFSYYLITVLVMMGYKPKSYTVQIDDGPEETITIHSGLICNMEYGGGGMKLAPGAIYDDGKFDFVIFGDITFLDFATKPPSWLFEGKHIEHPKVEVRKGGKIRISGDDDCFVDADGETIGRIPMELEMMPNALTFLGLPK